MSGRSAGVGTLKIGLETPLQVDGEKRKINVSLPTTCVGSNTIYWTRSKCFAFNNDDVL